MAIDRNMRNIESDLEYENRIRPQELSTFSGQDKIVENLKIFIKAALMRGDSLDHVLLHGPPGLGKTTLANIIAREMGAQLKVTSGPVLDKPGDLAGLLTNLDAGDVLAVDSQLDIVARFQMTVSHVVFLHPHEGGIMVSFGVAVAVRPHDFELFFVFSPL